jgi:hypothetical protein
VSPLIAHLVRNCCAFDTTEDPSLRGLHYRESGMRAAKDVDDSSVVNVHGAIPTAWLKVAMLSLNLVVWLDAAVRLT